MDAPDGAAAMGKSVTDAVSRDRSNSVCQGGDVGVVHVARSRTGWRLLRGDYGGMLAAAADPGERSQSSP